MYSFNICQKRAESNSAEKFLGEIFQRGFPDIHCNFGLGVVLQVTMLIISFFSCTFPRVGVLEKREPTRIPKESGNS